MTDPSQLFFERIQHAKRVLITSHQDPDFDGVGSMIALSCFLKSRQVPHTLWLAEALDVRYQCLSAVSEIKQDVVFQEYDTLVVLDASQLSRVKNYQAIPQNFYFVINIDHHGDNDRFGDLNVVETASSTGEVLYRLFCGLNWTPDLLAASGLYAAILTDTGRFQFQNTTPQTLDVAAQLVKLGVPIYDLTQAIYEQYTPEDFDLLRMALAQMKTDEKLQYVYTCLPQPLPKTHLKVVDFLRGLKGFQIVAAYQEIERDVVKVNLRSKGDFDVAAFARQFGGGGHRRAAGITVLGKFDPTFNQIHTALQEALRLFLS